MAVAKDYTHPGIAWQEPSEALVSAITSGPQAPGLWAPLTCGLLQVTPCSGPVSTSSKWESWTRKSPRKAGLCQLPVIHGGRRKGKFLTEWGRKDPHSSLWWADRSRRRGDLTCGASVWSWMQDWCHRCVTSAITHDPCSEGPLLSLGVNALQSHPKILNGFVFVLVCCK